MLNSIRILGSTFLSVLCASSALAEDKPITGPIKTPFGELELYKGLPATAKDSQALFDELDFQRACQTYIWALPIVSFAEWQAQGQAVFGAGDCDLVVYTTYKDKQGILTANATTTYVLGFPDLARTGPLVIDYPPGPSAGGVGDFWQRPFADMGEASAERETGAKYLVIGPGQKVEDTTGYVVVHSPTYNINFGTRALDPDPARNQELLGKIKIYPFSQRDNPKPGRLIPAGDKTWSQVPPRGLDYWKRLHQILQVEPVEARDRMMMAMLAPLGIEKGKPFQPDERQTKLLVKGAEIGELMASNNSFNKRLEGARYRPDAKWDYVLSFDPLQEEPNFTQLDRRSAYFYEAVCATKAMTLRQAGVGQAYLGTYQDSKGQWFDGAKHYKLRVPPNPPAKQFWSLTVYDIRTRCLIDNKEQIADKSSRMPDLAKNADGSVDLYMGPTAPKGHEKNWIPTVPGKAWFVYFRLYAPLEPYLDASWPLPDIEMVR